MSVTIKSSDPKHKVMLGSNDVTGATFNNMDLTVGADGSLTLNSKQPQLPALPTIRAEEDHVTLTPLRLPTGELVQGSFSLGTRFSIDPAKSNSLVINASEPTWPPAPRADEPPSSIEAQLRSALAQKHIQVGVIRPVATRKMYVIFAGTELSKQLTSLGLTEATEANEKKGHFAQGPTGAHEEDIKYAINMAALNKALGLSLDQERKIG